MLITQGPYDYSITITAPLTYNKAVRKNVCPLLKSGGNQCSCRKCGLSGKLRGSGVRRRLCGLHDRSVMHDDDISDLYVGKVISQGEYFYDMVWQAMPPAPMCISPYTGKYSRTCPLRTTVLRLFFQSAWKALYLDQNITIKDDYGFPGCRRF